MQQHGRPELRGDEGAGKQQWKQVGCWTTLSSSLVTICVSVTIVVNVVTLAPQCTVDVDVDALAPPCTLVVNVVALAPPCIIVVNVVALAPPSLAPNGRFISRPCLLVV